MQESFKSIQVSSDGETSLSVYQGNLSDEVILKQSVRVIQAFPNLTDEFIDLLLERVKEKGFSNERLIKAINHVIDTCPYNSPSLANFLNFDTRIKLLSYSEVCCLVNKNEISFNELSHLRINGKLFYVRNTDKELYQLPDEL